MINNIRGREKFYKYEKYIALLTSFVRLFPQKFRINLFKAFRDMQGLKGIVFRYVLLKSIAIKCGDNVLINSDVYLLKPENIIIGDNVSIHPMGYIDATGKIVIGNDVSIAHGATIMSTSHKFENIEKPIKDQGIVFKPTVINDNVWIGAKATVLAGLEIESGSIIAANSVVTKNVCKNNIVGGVPATIIKIRKK